MHKIIFRSILNFIFLTLLQVLVLDNIQVLGFIQPYVYILFIFSLPVNISRNLTILLAFLLGISIDIFSNTLGLHAFSTLLVAVFRVSFLSPSLGGEEQANTEITARTLGFGSYLKYIAPLVLIHHLTLFCLDYFSITHIEQVIYQAVLSALLTILIILGIQLFKN